MGVQYIYLSVLTKTFVPLPFQKKKTQFASVHLTRKYTRSPAAVDRLYRGAKAVHINKRADLNFALFSRLALHIWKFTWGAWQL